MIYGAATSALASALERRAAPLTRLSLDHNPILDGGGAAIGAAVCGCRLVELSLAFCGVAYWRLDLQNRVQWESCVRQS